MEQRADDSRIERLIVKVEELNDRSIRIECDTKATAKTVEKLDHTVHGNGKIGLDDRVRALEKTRDGAYGVLGKLAQWLGPIAASLMASGALLWANDYAQAHAAKQEHEVHRSEETPKVTLD